MKSLTIEIKAKIGDRVVVPDLELKSATVIALYMGRYHLTYEIAYFHDGDRKTAYLNAEEFELKE